MHPHLEEAPLLADLKNAMRQFRRSPGFALTVVLTVALGVGATTAIFTLVHAVLLKSLPVEDPGGLWRVGDNEQCCLNGGLPDYQEPMYDWSLFSYRQYEQFRDHTPGFASLAAFESSDHEMAVRRSGSDHPAQPWYGEFVSGNSFDTLGLRPYAGRLLRPSDDDKGAPPVAVLSFQTWEQELGRDPSVIGSSFTINGQPVTIVGIAPPGFYSERLSPTPPAFWLPIHLMPAISPIDADLLERGNLEWLNVIGRIEPGAKPAAIQAQMQVELQQFLESPLANPCPRAPTHSQAVPPARAGRRRRAENAGPVQRRPAPPDVDRQLRSAHRLRQSRQPDACARGHATPADCVARRPRRSAQPAGAARPPRMRSACLVRRRHRHPRRMGRSKAHSPSRLPA
jgi:hypothetical protein